MVTMFNGVDARIDALNDRMDRMQAETNVGFEAGNARFDKVFEAIMSFDRWVSRIEGRLDAQSAGAAE